MLQGLTFIVKLITTFQDETSVCFVFEYLEGGDLRKLLQNQYSLFPECQDTEGRKRWVNFYAAEAIIALESVHSKFVIHRDIKPDNLIVDSEGHLKLIDFGFAKRLQRD